MKKLILMIAIATSAMFAEKSVAAEQYFTVSFKKSGALRVVSQFKGQNQLQYQVTATSFNLGAKTLSNEFLQIFTTAGYTSSGVRRNPLDASLNVVDNCIVSAPAGAVITISGHIEDAAVTFDPGPGGSGLDLDRYQLNSVSCSN